MFSGVVKLTAPMDVAAAAAAKKKTCQRNMRTAYGKTWKWSRDFQGDHTLKSQLHPLSCMQWGHFSLQKHLSKKRLWVTEVAVCMSQTGKDPYRHCGKPGPARIPEYSPCTTDTPIAEVTTTAVLLAVHWVQGCSLLYADWPLFFFGGGGWEARLLILSGVQLSAFNYYLIAELEVQFQEVPLREPGRLWQWGVFAWRQSGSVAMQPEHVVVVFPAVLVMVPLIMVTTKMIQMMTIIKMMITRMVKMTMMMTVTVVLLVTIQYNLLLKVIITFKNTDTDTHIMNCG